jgi:GT2 family glycosyltransferase/glycosyltransferase involved in cell wall biosynthesis
VKVLIVVHGYPPTAIGGTELYAEAHAQTLARVHGDTVTVLTRDHDASLDELAVSDRSRDGIRIIAINNNYRHTRSFRDTYASDEVGKVAEGIIEQLQPDVAHVHHLTHLSTSIVDSLARRGIPTFMTLHDYWLICHRGQLFDTAGRVCAGPDERGCGSCVGLEGNIGSAGFTAASLIRALKGTLPTAPISHVRRAAEAFARITADDAAGREQSRQRSAAMRGVCSRITQFFAPSEFIQEQFVRFGVPRRRITLSPYGLDHRLFRRTERKAPTSAGTVRLGFFGSLMVSKAPHLLIEAADRLPAGRVTVDLFGTVTPYHGDDSYRATLEPLLARPYVRLHGAIEHTQVAAAMETVDAVVAPSVWPENSPFVIHEALLAKVPVVASRIGGIPELVDHDRNGLLFEPGDVADLARQLTRLSGEQGLLDSLASSATTIRTIEDDVANLRRAYGNHGRDRRSEHLSAIVLNFQTPDETLLTVKALLQSDRRIDDLFVVNNGPADEQSGISPGLAALSPTVSLLHTGANLGFSGGMNVGIQEAIRRGATRVLLVNSDVIVPPDCIGHLEQALASTPGAGIAGPVMVARTDPSKVASRGISYSKATGRMRHHGFGSPISAAAKPKVQAVDAVSGCVMLITRSVMDAIGRLDDAYFFSFEDIDFCLRARRAGFTSIIAGSARVYHEGHRSIGQTTPARLYFAARNHLRLAQRANRSGLPFGLWAAPIVALNVAHAVRASGGSLAARLAAVARGTRDYARGRFGAGAESPRLTP